MPSPSVAIIIPTRNRHEFLRRCLSRLIPYVAANPDCSIVVSDDGDALDTRRALVGELAGVQVVQGPRRGPSANRNCGAAHATAELLVFLDDDCIPDENLIAAYRDASMKHPAVSVFEGRITALGKISSFADAFVSNETGGYLLSCNFAIRKDLFVKLNGFDSRYPFAAMEDVDFHLRVKAFSRVLFLHDARVWHEIERRFGWRMFQHHALSMLLFLHVHGLKATGKSPVYFLREAAKILAGRCRHYLRSRDLKDPEHLLFQVRTSFYLVLIATFWSYHASLARLFFPACCPGCNSIHALISGVDCTAISIKEDPHAH